MIQGKVLYRGQPGTGEATLYTVTAPKSEAIITTIIACNTTGSEATISLSTVPSGGSAGAANRILAASKVAANGSMFITDISIPLNLGDFISGLQGTSGAITVTVCGTEE